MDNESHRASVGVDRAPKFGKESNSLKLPCCAKKQDLVDSCQIFDLDDGSQQNTVESRMSCSNLERTKKRCVYIESSSDAVSMSNCKRLRKGDINVEDSAHSDSSKSDQEFLGGILTARKNRFNIPRCRLRELQIIHFKDMDQTPPLEVEGCLSWAKIILRHYHSVGHPQDFCHPFHEDFYHPFHEYARTPNEESIPTRCPLTAMTGSSASPRIGSRASSRTSAPTYRHSDPDFPCSYKPHYSAQVQGRRGGGGVLTFGLAGCDAGGVYGDGRLRQGGPAPGAPPRGPSPSRPGRRPLRVHGRRSGSRLSGRRLACLGGGGLVSPGSACALSLASLGVPWPLRATLRVSPGSPCGAG